MRDNYPLGESSDTPQFNLTQKHFFAALQKGLQLTEKQLGYIQRLYWDRSGELIEDVEVKHKFMETFWLEIKITLTDDQIRRLQNLKGFLEGLLHQTIVRL